MPAPGFAVAIFDKIEGLSVGMQSMLASLHPIPFVNAMSKDEIDFYMIEHSPKPSLDSIDGSPVDSLIASFVNVLDDISKTQKTQSLDV